MEKRTVQDRYGNMIYLKLTKKVEKGAALIINQTSKKLDNRASAQRYASGQMRDQREGLYLGAAYDRLKAHGEEEKMLARLVIFKDGVMKGTGAWANTLLGRDHHTQKKSDRNSSSGS